MQALCVEHIMIHARPRLFAAALALVASALPLYAQELPSDYQSVLTTLGKQGDFKSDVLKVNIPRSDLSVTVAGVKTPTPFGFGGWVAFTKGGRGHCQPHGRTGLIQRCHFSLIGNRPGLFDILAGGWDFVADTHHAERAAALLIRLDRIQGVAGFGGGEFRCVHCVVAKLFLGKLMFGIANLTPVEDAARIELHLRLHIGGFHIQRPGQLIGKFGRGFFGMIQKATRASLGHLIGGRSGNGQYGYRSLSFGMSAPLLPPLWRGRVREGVVLYLTAVACSLAAILRVRNWTDLRQQSSAADSM